MFVYPWCCIFPTTAPPRLAVTPGAIYSGTPIGEGQASQASLMRPLSTQSLHMSRNRVITSSKSNPFLPPTQSPSRLRNATRKGDREGSKSESFGPLTAPREAIESTDERILTSMLSGSQMPSHESRTSFCCRNREAALLRHTLRQQRTTLPLPR
ncbi:hypothetical protein LZ31DRAFT_265037 [Colletotrichum somersetense]|nr:hypothetical protein LZ31DRAFT_265037 [Colletotrichum somersetense]